VKRFTAVILAGGKATRLATLGLEVPKSLIALDGKPLLKWAAEWVKTAVPNVIVAAGQRQELVVENMGLGITLLRDADVGTGKALLDAARKTDAEFIIVSNADTINNLDLRKLLKEHLQRAKGATISLTRDSDAQNAGAFAVSGDGQILRSHEDLQPFGSGNPFTAWRGASTGVLVIPRLALLDPRIEDASSLEQDIVPHLIDSIGLFAFDNGDRLCLDVGVPDRLKLMQINEKKIANILKTSFIHSKRGE
jgi:Nucleoside-diphosphate-sugar pyrophosphorylase involved in lipopolysaccharide biosynthesis/translation initiation factor 2B, gamma/epsilon subunits (eIF-2Bgamma/eIF-2Bepsilon)